MKAVFILTYSVHVIGVYETLNEAKFEKEKLLKAFDADEKLFKIREKIIKK